MFRVVCSKDLGLNLFLLKALKISNYWMDRNAALWYQCLIVEILVSQFFLIYGFVIRAPILVCVVCIKIFNNFKLQMSIWLLYWVEVTSRVLYKDLQNYLLYQPLLDSSHALKLTGVYIEGSRIINCFLDADIK